MPNDFFAGVKLADKKQREHKKEADTPIVSVPSNDIPIDKLIDYKDSDGIGNDYIFGPVSDESIENLANGIQEAGFKTAVEVWDMKNGTYMIYSGHRRVHAMKYLGKKTVKCDVYELPADEMDKRLQFLRANINSRGAIKAASEGGDIYIAHQIKYLETILRRKGIKSQKEIDKAVCKEFNAKKTTVWKYKSLLNACEELVDAESKELILLEQAAQLTAAFDKDCQKIIVASIVKSIEDGHRLFGRDIDNLIKQIKIEDKESAGGLDASILQTRASSIIADIIAAKLSEEETEEKGEDKKNGPVTTYDRYTLKFSSLSKDITHNKIDDLKPSEVEDLLKECDALKESLTQAHLFSELMAGRYKGSEVFNSTKLDEKELEKFNVSQLNKLMKAYDTAGFDEVVNQISTVQADVLMREKEYK